MGWSTASDSGQIGKGEKWGFLLGHKCPKQGEGGGELLFTRRARPNHPNPFPNLDPHEECWVDTVKRDREITGDWT